MKKIFTYTLLTLLVISQLTATTRYSTGNGDWANTSTWTGGQLPQSGDSLVILAGHTVTVTGQENYNGTAMKIMVKGALHFTNGYKLALPCGSQVFVPTGGEITSAGAGGSSNRIEICGSVYWNSSDGMISGPTCLPAGGPNCASVLPVEISSVSAQTNGGNASVSWSTLSESNCSHFEVQKLQNDGFVTVGTVTSLARNGKSVSRIDYSFTDLNPSAGLNYYRLRQVDKDNSVDYSDIISLNHVIASTELSVYPNPSAGSFWVKCNGASNAGATVVIVNAFGNVAYTASLSQASHLQITGLGAGIYYVTVQDGSAKKAQMVVVR